MLFSLATVKAGEPTYATPDSRSALSAILDSHSPIVYIHNVRVHQRYMREKDREKFIRLANKRVNRAIKVLQLIGNLSSRSNYDYTEEDVRKIFDALKSELQSCEQRFQAGSKESGAFRLD